MCEIVEHHCRVCGLYNLEPPWGEDGYCPNYDICFCCGVESGYQDYTLESTKEYRKSWLASGAKWSEPKEKPKDWDMEKQMKNIPKAFQ